MISHKHPFLSVSSLKCQSLILSIWNLRVKSVAGKLEGWRALSCSGVIRMFVSFSIALPCGTGSSFRFLPPSSHCLLAAHPLVHCPPSFPQRKQLTNSALLAGHPHLSYVSGFAVLLTTLCPVDMPVAFKSA